MLVYSSYASKKVKAIFELEAIMSVVQEIASLKLPLFTCQLPLTDAIHHCNPEKP